MEDLELVQGSGHALEVTAQERGRGGRGRRWRGVQRRSGSVTRSAHRGEVELLLRGLGRVLRFENALLARVLAPSRYARPCPS